MYIHLYQYMYLALGAGLISNTSIEKSWKRGKRSGLEEEGRSV